MESRSGNRKAGHFAEAYQRLWPDAPFSPPRPEDVVLYDLPFAEWQRTRRFPQPTDLPV